MSRMTKLLTLISAFLLSIMAGLLVQDLYSSVFRIESIKNVEEVYPGHISGTAGVSMDEKLVYHTENNDPQIAFSFPAKQYNRVTILFSKPLVESLPIGIYYASENQGFSQERCVGSIGNANQKSIQIDLPFGRYDKIRVDIGNKEGLTYSLETIMISDVIPAFSWEVFICVSLVVGLCLNKKRRSVEKRVVRLRYWTILLDAVVIWIIILQIGAMPVYYYLLIGIAVLFILEETGFLFRRCAEETDA